MQAKKKLVPLVNGEKDIYTANFINDSLPLSTIINKLGMQTSTPLMQPSMAS